MTGPVTQHDPGKHNADLDLARGRIIEGGSWKRQRTVVLYPSSKLVPMRVVHSWLNLMYPPNQPVYRMAVMGTEVGEAYSNAIEQILATPDLKDWEFLLTIEADNCPPPDGLLLLLKAMEAHPEYSAISGLYWTKGPMGVPQAWGDPTDPVLNFRPQAPMPGQVMEVCGIGMGFALWRLKTFKDERLRRPWFKTPADEHGVGTQDLYFAADARKYGHRFAVDCSCLVGHWDHEGKFGPAEMMW